MSKHKYIVVGGSPFRGYTGTLTYTGLKVVGRCDTLKAAERLVKEKYDEVGGLILVIDAETGEAV